MTKQSSSRIRSSVTDDEFGGFRITIPPSGRWHGWFAALLFSLTIVWTAVLTRDPLLLIFSIPATLLIAYSVINNLAIRRIVIIDGKHLAIRTEIAGLSKTKNFDLARVRSFRPIVRSHARRDPGGVSPTNSVVFEYNGRCYRFGTGLSDEEILRMVKTIRDRFPIKDRVDDVEPLPVNR